MPPHLAEVWADRDLYPHAHRAAYTGLAATVDTGIEGLADALYERLLRPEGWLPYADTAPTLRALRAAGVPVAVVSNIGFDIRPLFAAWGLADLVDAFVLSYEVGRCKPDPAIFLRACGVLGVDPERALMVGDTPADAGAVRAGCAALVLPARRPGRGQRPGRRGRPRPAPDATPQRRQRTQARARPAAAVDGHRQRDRPLAVGVRGDPVGGLDPSAAAR